LRVATCEEYNPKENCWKTCEFQLPSARSGFGAVIYRGKQLNKNQFNDRDISIDELYICGGNDGNSILKSLESYSFKTGTWRQHTPMRFKRDEFALVVGSDHKIYAIGGFGGPTKYVNNKQLKLKK
jgi:hypothetical protein